MARGKGRGREAQPQGRIELRPQQQQQQQTEQNILFRLSIDDSTKQHLVIFFFYFQNVDPNNFVVGSDARDIRPTGVMKMVNNLRNGDWMVGSYVIGNSNEVVRIIDGAHRIEAVRILRASNDPEMRNGETSKFQQSCSH